MTLPPFQYSRGGLMTRPLRDTFVEDEEAGGLTSAGEEERVNIHVNKKVFCTAAMDSDMQVNELC